MTVEFCFPEVPMIIIKAKCANQFPISWKHEGYILCDPTFRADQDT